jgi:hypothetical protein
MNNIPADIYLSICNFLTIKEQINISMINKNSNFNRKKYEYTLKKKYINNKMKNKYLFDMVKNDKKQFNKIFKLIVKYNNSKKIDNNFNLNIVNICFNFLLKNKGNIHHLYTIYEYLYPEYIHYHKNNSIKKKLKDKRNKIIFNYIKNENIENYIQFKNNRFELLYFNKKIQYVKHMLYFTRCMDRD